MGDAPTDTHSAGPESISATAPLFHATTYDPDSCGTICPAIVRAVSEATGIPDEEMDRPLNDAIDVDALEGLFRSRLDGTPRAGGRIQFSYAGCRVALDSRRGEIEVYARSH